MMLHRIQSTQNEQLKHLAKLLNQAKYRREQQQTVLEGIHLLTAYLDADNPFLEHIYIPEHIFGLPEITDILPRIPQHCISIVSNGLLKKISSLNNADDVMTLIRLPHDKKLPETGDCVVLDNVQDSGNVGTVLRSAAASGITQVILGKGCADAFSPKVLRAGMGAHFLLQIYEHVSLSHWCQTYRHRLLATALSAHNPFSLYELDLNEPTAWIFGNEGAGISSELIALSHATVKIPMQGAIESLNIAQAATVCLFEQMRQRILAA